MMIKVASGSFSNHPKLRQVLLVDFPDAQFNDLSRSMNKSELIDFIGDAAGLVIGLDSLDDEVLAACPTLRIISKYGVGLDNIDLDACNARGIAVGWTGGTNKRSVAEMDLCFMLALTRNLYPASMVLKGGTWKKDGGFQLSGRTIGIVGLGHTGAEIVRLLEPFECKVLGNDIVDKSSFCSTNGVQEVDKEEIYRNADIITLHAPLTDLTHHLINRETLSKMKKTAFVINTARGPIVNQEDLKQALKDSTIAGAALDVYETEPPADMELLGLRNLFCTPHIGGNADEAIMAMGMSSIHHLKAFFDR